MTNLGRWDKFYVDVEEPQAYGDSDSYQIGADFLDGCARVEDWGCGLGWFRQFISPDAYAGIDGSHSKFADVVADLEAYRSETPGLFMRHVLEHNYKWRLVLANAIDSFTERMVIALFTPWQDEDEVELRFEEGYGVPTLGFSREAIMQPLEPFGVTCMELTSRPTHYGVEHVLLVSR